MDRVLVADDGFAVALCAIEVMIDLAKKRRVLSYRQSRLSIPVSIAKPK